MWQASITEDGQPITDRHEAEVAAAEMQMEIVEPIDPGLGIWGVKIDVEDERKLEHWDHVERRSIDQRRVISIEMP